MPNRFVSDKSETQDIVNQIEKQNKKKLAGTTMNIGKLVRAKIKEMNADLSGEYIDAQGKHFDMKLSGDGYTVSYGGNAKREVSASKEQACKLAKHSRKLESKKDE